MRRSATGSGHRSWRLRWAGSATAPALVLLALGWAAILVVSPWSADSVNDLFVYRSFAVPVLDGSLPYRDVFLEYPPLAAPAIAIPALLGTAADTFQAAFAAWTFLFAVATVLLCGALAARTNGDRRRALLAAALMPFLCGAILRTHFDLVPVALLLAALVLLLDDRPRAGMAVLGLAAMTKGFPLVAAPVALAWLGARTDRRTLLQAAAALLAALAIPAALALAVAPAESWNAVTYHLERPVQIESLPATGALALDALGLGDERPTTTHRSDGLSHPADDALSALTALALVAALAITALATARHPTPRQLVLASLTAVLAFALLGKVLSPQYLIWLVPLGALAFAWRLHALAAALAAAAIVTQLEFPTRYVDLVARDTVPILLVAARNALLVTALLLALQALGRGRGGQEHLLDRHRKPVATPLDDHGVQPRVLA